MTREILDQFQGKRNVTKIISDNGLVSYLTPSRSFADEASSLGASKLNTVEKENKHVLFLFNQNDEEVGRYYIGKRLQGKTPSEIARIKHNLVFFDSWNPNTKEWVPCVGMINKEDSVNIILKTGFEAYEKNKKVQNETGEQIQKKRNAIDYYSKYGYSKESREREEEERETYNFREFGTNDIQKIKEIENKRKEERKATWGAGIVIFFLLFVLPIFFMGLVQKCTGSHYSPFEDNDTEWQYKHTDKHY